MTEMKWPPVDDSEGQSETVAAATISTARVHNSADSWKHSDPGTFGLAVSLASLPTSELRRMVQLLTQYRDVFGPSAYRRRDLAMRELRRRLAVPR